jgi:hypothetical protein
MIGNANDHTPIPISRAPDTHGEAGKELCMVERQAIRGNLPARAGGAAGTADARNACIVGIDPGASTGIAIFRGGKLAALRTIEPVGIEDEILTLWPSRVIFEDSRLQSHTWTQAASRAAAAKMARNVGQIDAWSSLITAICAKHKIPCHGISPQGKGAKLNAEQFERMTGWTMTSNQHARDAAMVAWQYRGAK